MQLPGSMPVTAPERRSKSDSDFGVIDCDVHHWLRNLDDLIPYLSASFQRQVKEQGFLFPGSGYFNAPRQAVRTDLAADFNLEDYNGHEEGWNLERLRKEHLDRWHIDYAVLNSGVVYTSSVIPDCDYAAAICRAFNDWSLEQWIAQEPRLKLAMSISTSDPQLAAAEIDRIGDDPNVVAVLVPTGARRPYGNRIYDPIWEACQRNALVAFVHPGCEGAGMAGAPTGVGYPTYYMETRLARSQMAMAHFASLISEGTFEKFPDFRVALLEVDQYWVAGLCWKLDADWKSLRDQTPWLKQPPSEYFRKHIRIGSQPMMEPEQPGHLLRLLESMKAEDTLIYCSDWPHFDWNDPVTALPGIPKPLKQRILSENARELLGL